MFVAGYRGPEATTTAAITYASAMKYSALLSSAMYEKGIQGTSRYLTSCGA